MMTTFLPHLGSIYFSSSSNKKKQDNPFTPEQVLLYPEGDPRRTNQNKDITITVDKIRKLDTKSVRESKIQKARQEAQKVEIQKEAQKIPLSFIKPDEFLKKGDDHFKDAKENPKKLSNSTKSKNKQEEKKDIPLSSNELSDFSQKNNISKNKKEGKDSQPQNQTLSTASSSSLETSQHKNQKNLEAILKKLSQEQLGELVSTGTLSTSSKTVVVPMGYTHHSTVDHKSELNKVLANIFSSSDSLLDLATALYKNFGRTVDCHGKTMLKTMSEKKDFLNQSFLEQMEKVFTGLDASRNHIQNMILNTIIPEQDWEARREAAFLLKMPFSISPTFQTALEIEQDSPSSDHPEYKSILNLLTSKDKPKKTSTVTFSSPKITSSIEKKEKEMVLSVEKEQINKSDVSIPKKIKRALLRVPVKNISIFNDVKQLIDSRRWLDLAVKDSPVNLKKIQIKKLPKKLSHALALKKTIFFENLNRIKDIDVNMLLRNLKMQNENMKTKNKIKNEKIKAQEKEIEELKRRKIEDSNVLNTTTKFFDNLLKKENTSKATSFGYASQQIERTHSNSSSSSQEDISTLSREDLLARLKDNNLIIGNMKEIIKQVRDQLQNKNSKK